MTNSTNAGRPRAVPPKLTPLQLAQQAVADHNLQLALDIARDPDTGPDALAVLAESQRTEPAWVGVRARIARRDDLDDNLLIILSEDDDKEVAGPIADRAQLPDEAYLNLIWHPFYRVRERLERRTDVPERVIRTAYAEALEDDEEMVLCFVAASASTPTDVLHALKDAPHWRVVERICLNPRTSRDTVHAIITGDFAHDELLRSRHWFKVIEKAAMRSDLQPDDRKALGKHPDWRIREKIALHGDLEPGERDTLSHDENWRVVEKIALNEHFDLGPEIIERLGGHQYWQVRKAIASRTEITKPAYRDLASRLAADRIVHVQDALHASFTTQRTASTLDQSDGAVGI